MFSRGDLSIKNDLVPISFAVRFTPSESGMLPSTLKLRGLANISSCAAFSSVFFDVLIFLVVFDAVVVYRHHPAPPSPQNLLSMHHRPRRPWQRRRQRFGDNTARLSVLDGRDRRVAGGLAMLSSGNTQQRRREGLGSVIEQPQSSFKSPSPWTESVALLEICRCFAHGTRPDPEASNTRCAFCGSGIPSLLILDELRCILVCWAGAARYF